MPRVQRDGRTYHPDDLRGGAPVPEPEPASNRALTASLRSGSRLARSAQMWLLSVAVLQTAAAVAGIAAGGVLPRVAAGALTLAVVAELWLADAAREARLVPSRHLRTAAGVIVAAAVVAGAAALAGDPAGAGAVAAAGWWSFAGAVAAHFPQLIAHPPTP